MEKEKFMQVLETICKVILVPAILIIKGIMIASGTIIKLVTMIIIIGVGGTGGLFKLILCLASSLSVLLLLYSWIYDKGGYTPLIAAMTLTALGAILIEFSESLFDIAYYAGEVITEKGIEMPIWL